VIATALGASIEGKEIHITSRKLNLREPRVAPQQLLLYPFRTGINSKAEIIKELVPKLTRIKVTSRLDKGDQLVGVSIAGHAEKPISKAALVKGSGRHKAKQIKARGGSFAEISIPRREILTQQASNISAPHNSVTLTIKKR